MGSQGGDILNVILLMIILYLICHGKHITPFYSVDECQLCEILKIELGDILYSSHTDFPEGMQKYRISIMGFV